MIVAVAFKMMKVPSRFVAVRERRVRDLDEFLEALEEVRRSATYSVGWIDALAKGASSAAVSSRAPSRRRLEEGERYREARRRRVPFDFPAMALNPLSIGLFNAWHWRARRHGSGRVASPLTASSIPSMRSATGTVSMGDKASISSSVCCRKQTSRKALRVLLETCVGSRAASFLGVLKTMGQEGTGMISFGGRGHTLALDFPARAGIDDLLTRLERMVLDNGGRIYAAKDSHLSAAGFAAMYPSLAQFRSVLAEVDPEQAHDLRSRPPPRYSGRRAMSERPLWLVLGASSSVARAFARLVAERGGDLILAGRDIADIERTAADARIRGAARVDVRAFDAIDRARP